MGVIIFSILFPMVIAFAFLAVKSEKMREVMVYASTIVIAGAAIITGIRFFATTGEFFSAYGEDMRFVVTGLNIALAAYIVFLSIRHRNIFAALLSVAQTVTVAWFEFSSGGHIDIQHNISIDKFSVVMILIISLIGSAMCIYGLGYVRRYRDDAPGMARIMFFSMFLAIGSMIGLVSSNNMIWMYLFWQISTLSSFWMTACDGSKESLKRGFKVININLLGGMSFVVGILIIGMVFGTLEFSTMMIYGKIYGNLVLIPATFFAFAGIARAALMPFNSWLTSSMHSPAPAAGLITAAVINGGAFILIKLAPAMSSSSFIGVMIMMVGGVTFLFASFVAIPKKDIREILACSTTANMGLVAVCTGLGVPEALWAAIMMVMLHSFLKTLLIVCFGTAGSLINSSRIEDMEGMFPKLPVISILIILGMTAMFLAPFGILLCGWISLVAVVNAKYLTIGGILCFGFAVSAYYGVALMARLTAASHEEGIDPLKEEKPERIGVIVFAAVSVILCLGLPLISSYLLVPYLKDVYGGSVTTLVSSADLVVMVGMIALLLLVGLLLFGRRMSKPSTIYLAGVNKGDNRTYYGAMENEVEFSLGDTYMGRHFNERRINLAGSLIAVAFLATGIGSVISNFIELLGGGVQ